MQTLKQVTIVGLGLMGGSLAMGLRPWLKRLAAVDNDPETCRRALEMGLVDSAADDLAQGIAGADLVVLAAPARAILTLLVQLPRIRPEGCRLLDLGSTKGEICRAMDKLPANFAAIGGHPMCGRERSGLAAAQPNLYRGKRFILCRTGRTTPAVEATALQIIEWLGAQPLFLPADEHDRMVAAVSHLPYMVAASLMAVVNRSHPPDSAVWQVSASGWRDTTRLAGSDPRMMLDILMTNRAAVLDWLGEYAGSLEELTALLRRGDEEELFQWLTARRREHNRQE